MEQLDLPLGDKEEDRIAELDRKVEEIKRHLLRYQPSAEFLQRDREDLLDELQDELADTKKRTIAALANRAYTTACNKGWRDIPRTPGDGFALIHSEVSEALEAYRNNGFVGWTGDGGKPEGVLAELADVVIRVFDFAVEHFGEDELQFAIHSKMNYNETREHRHGGKFL